MNVRRFRRPAGLPLPLLFGAALCALLPPAARADLYAEVNQARLRSCGMAPGHALEPDAKLVGAAQRLADGQGLHEALVAVGYLETQSSVLHLSGAMDDAAVGRAVAASFCRTATDPSLTQIGGLRRGRDVWLILAAPARLPSTAEATHIAAEILTLVNRARAVGRRCGGTSFAAVGTLTLNAALSDAAIAHSRDMARNGGFDHRGHDGSSPASRIARAGFGPYAIVGENIAAGAMNAVDVTSGWLSSPPHCENIMDPRFTMMGIAFAVNAASSELVFWTQDFAAPRAARAVSP